mmetsp:Transcript_41936/g.67429  ORF Transcript_41936/g.67429 Transcript_41936/m.67429 type:complete len:411 (-) Transcript_41936:182-1414(-)|eukprot:CAMPEP_0197057848 /NCGR_PEP_ID=MMETSP1384-20130603/101535_1 /TAXON_ID=29189 /ORGANISM="Ammonia sp." /LENGTH=410 /DNA_ID=CAMNT_0042492399 /DNA_START=36 /DNA_END=1268 /DNA_ORIENTATION=-
MAAIITALTTAAALCYLSDIAYASEPVFTFLGAWEGLADSNETAESCAYDSVNDKWVFFKIGDGSANTLPGDYPASQSTLGDNDWFQATGEAAGWAADFVLGTLGIAGDVYFVVAGATTYAAQIRKYNVETDTFSLVHTFDIGVAGANALCYDEENDVLYVTFPGLNFFADPIVPINGAAAIYTLSGITSADSITVSSLTLTDMKDQDGNVLTEANTDWVAITGANRVLHPNGCSVGGGKAWFVEYRGDGRGDLAVYDIQSEEFALNVNVLPNEDTADGLIVIGGHYLVMSSFLGGYLKWYDLDLYPDGEFALVEAVGTTALFGAADIAYNTQSNVICVPQNAFGPVTEGGVLNFIQFDAHEVSTTLWASTTFEGETTEEPDAAQSVGITFAHVLCVISVLATSFCATFM